MKLHLFFALFLVYIPFGVSAPNKGGISVGNTFTSLWDDTTPMLWYSKIVYVFADLIKTNREDNVFLNIPDGMPDLSQFEDKSLDFRKYSGLPFNLIYEFLHLNREQVKAIRMDDGDSDYFLKILDKVKARDDQYEGDDIFLETFRSLRGNRQCVYGVLRNTKLKRIIIVFRGSLAPGTGTRDWETNFNAFLAKMETPALLKGKLKGKLNERVLVHKGFYEYLFDNDEKLNKRERYEMILDDIKPLLEQSKGYSIFVTGHSLGAALSSTAAFQLAGEDKEWIPKPVTCVSFASPITGTSGYRTAFEQLERDNMIRYIRINNFNDLIVSVPPISLGFLPRPMKHVGLNLRFYNDKFTVHHSSQTRFIDIFQNSLLKNPFKALDEHSLPLIENRMQKQIETLKSTTIEKMYVNSSIFDSNALASKVEL